MAEDMAEESAVTDRKDIKKKGLYVILAAAATVLFTLVSVLDFFGGEPEGEQVDTVAEAAPPQTVKSSQTKPRTATRPTRDLASKQERFVVLASRKANCTTLIDAASHKLQQTGQLIEDHATMMENLQTNELGRQIAANDDLIEMFLALSKVELPTTVDTEEGALSLDGLQTKLQLLRSGSELEKVDQLSVAIQELNQSAQQLHTQITLAQRDLAALLLLAEAEAASNRTLDKAAERYELQITADHQLRMTQAMRESREKRQATEQSKAKAFNQELSTLRNELSDAERRVKLADEHAKQELAKRAEAKRKLEVEFERDLSDIKSLLKPFITPGHTQHLHKFAYRADQNPNPRPVSFGSLKGLGYLHDTTERLTAFWRSTSHENDRPFGSFPKAPYGQTRLKGGALPAVRRAQGYLQKYGDLMVEKGMLSP